MANKKTATLKQHTDFYLTPEGLKEAKEQLRFLKEIKRAEVADRIKAARESGGVEENSEYNAAMEEYTMVEARIEEIEKILRSAKVIERTSKASDIVTIGSTVVVEMDGEIDEFTIVGRIEANPANRRISNESPLGIALLGAKKNEEVEVATPIVRYKCKVLEIK